MDIEAANSEYKREDKTVKKDWECPCNGCSKAVKQERKRIWEEIDKIDLDTQAQINALGLKILLKEILNIK